MNPKEAKGAYLTYTIQCPGEVGGKGCGSLSCPVTIRPFPSTFGPSVPDRTVFFRSPTWEIPTPGKGSGGGFPFGLRLGRGELVIRALEVWKRGRTWPSRRSDIPAVPRGRFAFMPRGGDYSGFGLRGQERRKRFDLRAEVEPPSPSARVTHWGCGWEVDPERGLNQATGLGVGVEGVGREAGKVWWGRPGEGAQPGSRGCRAAGLRPAPALHPLSPVPRILSGLGATRSAASSERRLRWRAWDYQTHVLRVNRKPAEGDTQVSVRVLFWLPGGQAPASVSLPA